MADSAEAHRVVVPDRVVDKAFVGKEGLRAADRGCVAVNAEAAASEAAEEARMRFWLRSMPTETTRLADRK